MEVVDATQVGWRGWLTKKPGDEGETNGAELAPSFARDTELLFVFITKQKRTLEERLEVYFW